VDREPADVLDRWAAERRAERSPDGMVAKQIANDARTYTGAALGLEGEVPERLVRGRPVMLPVKRWGGELGWRSLKRQESWAKLLARRGVTDAPLSRGVLLRCQVIGAEWVPHPDVPASWAVTDIEAFERYVATGLTSQEVEGTYRLALEWRADNAAALHDRLTTRIGDLEMPFSASYHPYSGLQYVDIALVVPADRDQLLRLKNVWQGESALAELVRQFFPDAVREHSPSWLGSQRLDVWVPSRSLAFEYHGEQHYHAVAHFGGEEALRRTQERDARKREACERAGVTLIEWPYRTSVTADMLRHMLAIEGVHVPALSEGDS
jgi:hypothetical protein